MNNPSLTVNSSAKFLELARKIKEIEAENAKLAVKLEKSNQHLFRLQLERSILMEKLKQVNPRIDAVPTEDSIKAEILEQVDKVQVEHEYENEQN